MASHEQINQNYADVNNAWGQLQYLVTQYLPGKINGFYRFRGMANGRRNYS